MPNKPKATESMFNELHNIVTLELLNRIKSGEASTADLKASLKPPCSEIGFISAVTDVCWPSSRASTLCSTPTACWSGVTQAPNARRLVTGKTM